MKHLHIKLVFPYNWYQYRKVKIYDDKDELITHLNHCEQKSINISSSTEFVILKLDYFKSKIKLPKENDNIYLISYLDFRDSFPIKYFDLFKRKCLTGKLVDKKSFDKFNLDFYEKAVKQMKKSKPNLPNLLLGTLISLALIFFGTTQQQNKDDNALVIFIGVASLVSLLLIYKQRKKLLSYDYKSRVIATGIAFLLAIFFLNGLDFYLLTIILIFSLVFLYFAIRKVEV
ncbi:hypothetical protein [Haloflavibacter putidus]|uniref:Uncharacterized protein n=1 Tax=Haloflavibacter putidus TaxID=2576776 RepID=A0A507ZPS7_9FLAO|nr:hypothetical protein [Haloflavibacter putidus]TQD39319.1 hypothetical protein FKR84_05345 [Haloflavibacter putidus]